MLTFRTGSEREHIVAIAAQHIVALAPRGDNFTVITTVEGKAFLVDGSFETVKEKVEVESNWEARWRDEVKENERLKEALTNALLALDINRWQGAPWE